MNCNYSVREIQKGVNNAIGVLFKNDSFLLINGANERSVSHKLAEYLQKEFPDWNVDCEYNRSEGETKVLEEINECSNQRTTDRIYPDIIVHIRNTKHNLLVIEIKTNSTEDPCDIKKLKLMTRIGHKFEYKLGLYIKFNKTEEPKLRWFQKWT